MIRLRPPKRLASNAAATLAALALTFGYLVPRPCLCLGCEAGVGQEACCCEEKASPRGCCQGQLAQSAAPCNHEAPAGALACDGCSCGAAPEPTLAISVAHSHEDLGAAPAALVGEPVWLAHATSAGAFLPSAEVTGSPPGIRLHALYSVWLN